MFLFLTPNVNYGVSQTSGWVGALLGQVRSGRGQVLTPVGPDIMSDNEMMLPRLRVAVPLLVHLRHGLCGEMSDTARRCQSLGVVLTDILTGQPTSLTT